jgi:hypothetical protein
VIASEERLWEFQTRLMENVAEIHSHYRTNASHVNKPPQGYNTYRGTIPPTMTAKIDSAVPTLNAAGSTSLLSQEEASTSYKFIDLPASIVQKLTPKVEVYKVYPPENEGEPDRAYLLHQGVHRAEDIRRELREGTIKASDNNRQGVVLQAVDFTRLGGNPAEVHTNIKFNIKLYAKNITEFFTKSDSFPDTYDETSSGHLVMDDAYDQIKDGYSSALRQRDSAQAASEDQPSNDAALDAWTDSQTRLNAVTQTAATARRIYIDATDLKQTAWIDIIKIDPGQELTANAGNPAIPIQTPPANNQLQVVERDVRIKVKIGYSLPETKPSDIRPIDWTNWQETVAKQKEEFFLSLLKHEWSFLGMQGVELSVDFIATGNAETLAPSSDLFGGLSYERYKKQKIDSFSNQRQQMRTHAETLSGLHGDISIHQSTIEEKERLLASAEATKSTAITNRDTDEEAISQGIINILNSDIAGIIRDIDEVREKIAACEERLGELADEERHLNTEINDTKAAYRTRLLRQLTFDYGLTATATNMHTRVYRAKVPSTLSWSSNIGFSYPTPTGGAFETYSSGEARLEAWNQQDIRLVAEEDGTIYNRTELEGDNDIYTVGNFVFVGDIIEAACECLYAQKGSVSDTIIRLEEEVRVAHEEVLSEGASVGRTTRAERRRIEARQALFDEFLATQPPFASLGGGDFNDVLREIRTITTGKVTYPHPIDPELNWLTLNISDIPISLDLFRTWWIEKARTKNLYPMRDFLPDLMTFVSDMFKNLKYRQGASPVDVKSYQLPKFIMNTVSYNNTWNAEETNEKGKYVFLDNSWFQRYLNEAKSSSGGRTTTVIEQADVPDMPSHDVPNVIFGQADRGILKQITFEREDIPGHAEARLMTDRESVASNIALREKYNVNLEMRGTTSFLPGSVLYLDITPIELGYTDEDNSYAKQLGLGGMYRVVSVQSSLGLDGKGNSWVTNLKTKWESFGDGTNGDPDTVVNNTLSGGDCS